MGKTIKDFLPKHSIEILTLITTVITLGVSITSCKVAKISQETASKTYDYASLSFSIIPEIEKTEDTLIIKNKDKESFKINSVSVSGCETWWIDNLQEPLVYLIVEDYHFSYNYGKDIDLNDIQINLNDKLTINGKKQLSAEEDKKFEKLCDINMATLQSQQDVSYGDRRYLITIYYFNKKSYRSHDIQLQILLDETGNIEEIAPLDTNISHCTFDFINNRNDFKREWDKFISYINGEYNSYDPYNRYNQ